MKLLRKLFNFTFSAAVLTIMTLALTGAAYWGGLLPADTVVEKVPVPVKAPEKSVDDLIEEIAPAYGLKPFLLRAIFQKESGFRVDAYRFEPGQMARAAKLTKDPQQQKMLASSHGLGQIMGYNALSHGISWSQLYDPRINIELTAAMIRNGIDRRKNKMSKARALRGALHEYNGSEAYADDLMDAIGEALIEQEL